MSAISSQLESQAAEAEPGVIVAPESAQAPAKRHLYQIDQPEGDGRVERFLHAFDVILRHSNYRQALDIYTRSGARCGQCSSTCPVYQVTRDPKDIPCFRTHILLGIYQRYFTSSGRFKHAILGNGELTEPIIDELIDSLYRCTACRRCTLECALGVDHALMTHLGRYILSEAQLAPKALQVSVRAQLEGESHNTSAVPPAAIRNNLEFLEEEIEEEKGLHVPFPVDREGAEYILFPPVSDILMEAETLMGLAWTLHVAGEGENWTLGSEFCDAINYGLFYNDWILERNIQNLVEEARRLKARNILIGECGHASRTAKQFVPLFGGENVLPVINCVELAYQLYKQGKLRLDANAIDKRVTYHDPCNIARLGWIVDQPRALVKAMARDFVEMTPNGRHNYCCGGGGGTVSIDEMQPFRMEIGGRVKADQMRATEADIVIAPCANCKKQLRELVDHYELKGRRGEPMQVQGIHDLLYLAALPQPAGAPAGIKHLSRIGK